MKKCPFCAEEIQDEAIKCRYCGSALAPTNKFGSPLDQADSDIRQLVRAGKKIDSIKLTRERHGLDLKAAKDYVEHLEKGGPAGVFPTPAPATAAKSSATGVIVAVIVLLVLGGWLLTQF